MPTQRKKKKAKRKNPESNLYYNEDGTLPIWSPTTLNFVLYRIQKSINRYADQKRPRKVRRWNRRKEIVIERLIRIEEIMKKQEEEE